MTPERRIALEGCFNFRDLGGYAGLGGRPVRWRSIFRADGLSRLTANDLDILQEIGLRTVIDLRTSTEVAERGRIEDHPELAYVHLPMIDVLPPDDELHQWADPAYVAGQYAQMLAAGEDAVRGVLGVLCDPASYPVAYHCMAGKDRTGILSALILGLLGVADEDILADYALSQESMRRMLAWLREAHPERAGYLDTAESALVAAEPESMALFLARLRSEHGGIEDYVARIGMPNAGGILRRLLLEA